MMISHSPQEIAFAKFNALKMSLQCDRFLSLEPAMQAQCLSDCVELIESPDITPTERAFLEQRHRDLLVELNVRAICGIAELPISEAMQSQMLTDLMIA